MANALYIPTSKPDPWIKVGTTTIDGTLEQVGSMLRILKTDGDEDAIDAFMRADGPWLVGGRYLIARGSHVNMSSGTALIRCDIVRRQSEIDAEQVYAVRKAERHEMICQEHCPECGPHGNRGEVMLAESWAKCTTCNGGKAGDLWGAVEPVADIPKVLENLRRDGLIQDAPPMQWAEDAPRLEYAFVEWNTGFDAVKAM